MENTQAALICMCVDTPGWGICFSKEPMAWKMCGLYWGVLSLRIHCIQDVFSSSEKLTESKNKRAQRKPKKALLVKENAFVTICWKNTLLCWWDFFKSWPLVLKSHFNCRELQWFSDWYIIARHRKDKKRSKMRPDMMLWRRFQMFFFFITKNNSFVEVRFY